MSSTIHTTNEDQELFGEVLTQALETDPILGNLTIEVRASINALILFVGATTPVLHAYKTLQSWPTHIPASEQPRDFQLALEATVSYLYRRTRPKVIPLLVS